jgi:uncharacterized protein (TIGR00725 family)
MRQKIIAVIGGSEASQKHLKIAEGVGFLIAYVDIPIATGMHEARNIIIARTCDCAIAIDGRYGTLSEIAYCLIFNRPVIGINTWSIKAPIIQAQTAQEAVDLAFKQIAR